jgi:hypothetical protein
MIHFCFYFKGRIQTVLEEKEAEQDYKSVNEELRRENKDLKSQIKKMKKIKSGQGDEALEVLHQHFIIFYAC